MTSVGVGEGLIVMPTKSGVEEEGEGEEGGGLIETKGDGEGVMVEVRSEIKDDKIGVDMAEEVGTTDEKVGGIIRGEGGIDVISVESVADTVKKSTISSVRVGERMTGEGWTAEVMVCALAVFINRMLTVSRAASRWV